MSIDRKAQQDSRAASIDVTGPGDATVFVRGDDVTDFEMGSNLQVDVPVQNFGQFRMYGTSADERFLRSPTLTRLEYMHVSVHPIGVTAD